MSVQGPLKIIAHDSRHVERDQTKPDFSMPDYDINLFSTEAIGERMILNRTRAHSKRLIH
jgi:hypothetical protein